MPAGEERCRPGGERQAAFGKLCARCHGEEAGATRPFPASRDSRPSTLKRTIARYRDKTGERIYPLMQIATATLKNEEIAALASYLAALP